MGKRSRKQHTAAVKADADEPIRGSGARARKARMQQRASAASAQAEKLIKERPAAPWDPFPLTELSIFSGFLLFVAGALVGGPTGKGLMAAGAVLVLIGGLETMLREHFGGYRSHAGILAGILALAALIVSTAVFKVSLPIRAAIVIGIYLTVFPALRQGFVRRSGGKRIL